MLQSTKQFERTTLATTIDWLIDWLINTQGSRKEERRRELFFFSLKMEIKEKNRHDNVNAIGSKRDSPDHRRRDKWGGEAGGRGIVLNGASMSPCCCCCWASSILKASVLNRRRMTTLDREPFDRYVVIVATSFPLLMRKKRRRRRKKCLESSFMYLIAWKESCLFVGGR